MTSRLNFRPVSLWPLHEPWRNVRNVSVRLVFGGAARPPWSGALQWLRSEHRNPLSPRFDHRVAAQPGPPVRRASLVAGSDDALDSGRNFTPGRQKSLGRTGRQTEVRGQGGPEMCSSTGDERPKIFAGRPGHRDARAWHRALTQCGAVEAAVSPIREGRANRARSPCRAGHDCETRLLPARAEHPSLYRLPRREADASAAAPPGIPTPDDVCSQRR